jgi:hypothetical protein
MHSDCFNGIEILQGRWQHGKKVGYCYPSGLEKTLCKWDIYVPLVTNGLMISVSVTDISAGSYHDSQAMYCQLLNLQSDVTKHMQALPTNLY